MTPRETPGPGDVRRQDREDDRAGTPTDSAAGTPETGAAVDPGERRRMIAEAAYYRSEAKGFPPGCAEEDWIDAEAEIDARLSRTGGDR